jgi:hypothetical protein
MKKEDGFYSFARKVSLHERHPAMLTRVGLNL